MRCGPLTRLYRDRKLWKPPNTVSPTTLPPESRSEATQGRSAEGYMMAPLPRICPACLFLPIFSNIIYVNELSAVCPATYPSELPQPGADAHSGRPRPCRPRCSGRRRQPCVLNRPLILGWHRQVLSPQARAWLLHLGRQPQGGVATSAFCGPFALSPGQHGTYQLVFD
jgi:hypothetical protein